MHRISRFSGRRAVLGLALGGALLLLLTTVASATLVHGPFEIDSNAMDDEESARNFAKDMVLLEQSGVNPVVVHGGGPQIGAMLAKLGIKSAFSNGLRITDRATIEIVAPIIDRGDVYTGFPSNGESLSPAGANNHWKISSLK